ncbi:MULTISPECIES: phage holin family protein [unclassified Leisingera]|uniref:phage holin family protein n=1 Tax=unclassified Leisingera TaxID=2614906 RepID=UPI00058069B4|nr:MULTISPECIES: phage holin family protein [unclassified Leisingera]KIC17367.1 membrane protein [Leisingera sp. ANG-DT]KIC30603.1 membrane protein [Leisingera sp. ANG-M6]
MTHPDLRAAPELFLGTLRNFVALLRSESELAKGELKEKAAQAGTGLAFMTAAAIAALAGLHVLAAALVAWITAAGLSPGLAALVVGGALLTAAVCLLLAGKSRLSSKALLPSRTIRSIKQDAASIREAGNAGN